MSSTKRERSRVVAAGVMGFSILLACAVIALCQTAPTQSGLPLLVSLDARDPSAGTDLWKNLGSLGPFKKIGAPQLREIGGVRAVYFDGLKDGYEGPLSTAQIEGAAPRSIEVWAYVGTGVGDEAPMIAWGRRGGPAGTNMSFGYGRNGSYGAAVQWQTDLGWNGLPEPGYWHYLVYTYDGQTARVYQDTAVKNVLPVVLSTPSSHVNIAVQNAQAGGLAFINEFNNQPAGSPIAIAEVRVEAGALTSEEIAHNFQAEAAYFHATPISSAYDLLVTSGTEGLSSPSLTVQVSEATGEALSLSPTGSSFNYLPTDRLEMRAIDGFYQLGDIDFRLRTQGSGWKSYSSAASHKKLETIILPNGVAADLTPLFDGDCPVSVERQWVKVGNDLAMRFVIRNESSSPVEIGGLGAAMVHNNILTGRNLEETHEKCSFADPYVGGDAGYLQITRLNGEGPVLLITPERGTGFEAYRPLHDDPTPRSATFEGFYEWTVHSKAYAQDEWKNARNEWNTPTSRIVKPREAVTYGFRFFLAPSVRKIESTLIQHKRPVAVGIPGYVAPTDQETELFLHAPLAIKSVSVEPANNLRIEPTGWINSGWSKYTIRGEKPGQCRVAIRYVDGSVQYVHYLVTLPAAEQVRNLGKFHEEKQWYTDTSDPFGRTFSYMPYHETTHELVSQYDPTWMVGESDEMGAGPNLLMAAKNEGQPDPAQVKQLEKYVDNVLWGHLQGPDYSIRASLFYYDPRALNKPGYYKVTGGWDKARTQTTWRSYNYPHQAAVYWSLYRLARYHTGLVAAHPAKWYLEQAYETAMAMGRFGGPPPGGYQQFGQMVGDVFLRILDDLKREGMVKEAQDLESYEKGRADHFNSLPYPYGSEMPWDSTGQEEVYLLCSYFGYTDKAKQTVDAVLAYDPTVPNWGYNGSARRYFDEAVNGTQWPDIMRELHQYGGTMNAIPVLSYYRENPGDLYLLRVGYGGTMGALSDIAPDGFGSQCFDADPAIMAFDPYVGDFGVEFYGFAYNTGAYVTDDPTFGWLGFGCNVAAQSDAVSITPCDAFRNRLFVAPLDLFVTLDSGTIRSAVYDRLKRTVRVTLDPKTASTPVAYLDAIRPSSQDKAREPQVHTARQSLGHYAIDLGDKPVTVTITVP